MSDAKFQAALRFHEAGRVEDAARLYAELAHASPPNLQALYQLGFLQLQTAKFAEAERSFTAAIALSPNIPEFHYGRGCACQRLRRYEDALANFARALSLRPDYVEARNDRGVTLLTLKCYGEALTCFEGLNVTGSHSVALISNNRAVALLELQRYQEALSYCEKSLALLPDQPDALSTYAATLMALRRYDDALAAYDRALRLKPDFVEALNHRGSALRELKRLDQALASYDHALRLQPGLAEARNNRGMVRLLVGRYREGWVDHEWRWEAGNILTSRPKINAPPWQGQDLTARRIAVYHEQGLGDVIQFVRYLPLLVERGAEVTFLAPERLVRLLQPLNPWSKIVSSIDDRESFNFQCALMSLPLWLGTELSSIPDGVPYLKAEESLVARWKPTIAGHGFKIGIAWQGAPGRLIDQGRSIPLAEFIPLARLPGVRLISLQKTHGLDQIAGLPADIGIESLGDEFDAAADAFVDTAAVMSSLDAIITSDTSIAHLAGALGCPTWVALKYVPDWRWLLDRDDSPWYPTMRLFRQETAGDWKGVFARMAEALLAETSRRNISRPSPA